MKILAALLLCVLIAPSLSAQPTSRTLATVLSRGQVVCGLDEEVFGFGFLNPNTGDITGIQTDFCRAIAAALLGEAAAVDLRLHRLEDTLPVAFVEGELDLLFSHRFNYTLSAISQAELSQSNATVFYDGVSVMARSSSEIVDWESIDGLTVCVVEDSASASDLSIEAERRDVDIDLLAFESIAAASAAFTEGRCAAQALEQSLLEIIRQSSSSPDDFIIWSRPVTLWPIKPIVRSGDSHWIRVIDSILWGLIKAEALGVNSSNIEQYAQVVGESNQAYLDRVGEDIANLLNLNLALGLSVDQANFLGLPRDFLVPVIRQVGNYGEIYERHLGPNSSLPIDRGLNALWIEGGLLTAPRWP